MYDGVRSVGIILQRPRLEMVVPSNSRRRKIRGPDKTW